jgi:uncharacterized protein YcfJ
MNSYMKLSIITGVALFSLNGCVGPVMPNNSAQTGVATGAIAGAIMGANTKGDHKGRRIAIGAAIGATAGGLLGNTVDEQTPQSQQTGGWQ